MVLFLDTVCTTACEPAKDSVQKYFYKNITNALAICMTRHEADN
jgi:hypothetical protein